ncbi:response regulator [Herbaspirillum huttiense]|uniref:response regulator n=1 Tax=Herbaspirillum huttiense TaxID=863372 RepID=UPI0039AEA9EC
MKPPIILMIESNGEAVELARFALWRQNFHCVLQWYDEADAAIERLLQRRQDGEMQMPGMIFLDPGMMENNGLDFIQAMKAGRDTRSVPIVVFPDSDYPPEMPALIEAGAVEYLLKPETAQQYMEVVVDRARRWSKRRRRRASPASAGNADAAAEPKKAGGED